MPFYLFLGRAFSTEIDRKKSGYPYSKPLFGGPRLRWNPAMLLLGGLGGGFGLGVQEVSAFFLAFDFQGLRSVKRVSKRALLF